MFNCCPAAVPLLLLQALLWLGGVCGCSSATTQTLAHTQAACWNQVGQDPHVAESPAAEPVAMHAVAHLARLLQSAPPLAGTALLLTRWHWAAGARMQCSPHPAGSTKGHQAQGDCELWQAAFSWRRDGRAAHGHAARRAWIPPATMPSSPRHHLHHCTGASRKRPAHQEEAG